MEPFVTAPANKLSKTSVLAKNGDGHTTGGFLLRGYGRMSEFCTSQDLKHDILGGVLQSKHKKHVHFTTTATKGLTHNSKIGNLYHNCTTKLATPLTA